MSPTSIYITPHRKSIPQPKTHPLYFKYLMKFDHQFHPEQIHKSVFIAEGVRIFGNVNVNADSSIWFNAVVRGDTEQIQIGSRTNIQDLSLIHADPGVPCIIGDDVTVGHSAIVHGATVESDVMIGMRATILNGAVIGRGSLIAAGCLVPERCLIPPNSVVMGTPGKIVRQCTDTDSRRIHSAAKHYVEAARAFR